MKGLWSLGKPVVALAVAGMLFGGVALGQPPQPSQPQQQPGQPPPREPVYVIPVSPLGVGQLPLPTILRPPQPPPPPQAPFLLSPDEAAQLDRVLADWEKRSREIKTFEADFTCWKYDAVFGQATEPKTVDRGVVKYAAPDKGLFRVDGPRAEQWICDGKSIFEYKYPEKKVVEHRLPPELQGKAIADGPLPFVFETEAQNLKQRYFLRLITPANVQGEVWLEAWPRFQQQAADFKKVQLILRAAGLTPYAIQVFIPGGKQRTVYQFDKPEINRPTRWLLGSDWFRASVPLGWKKIIEAPPPVIQATRRPMAGTR